MKSYRLGCAILLLTGATALAQVQVDLEFDQQQYLPGERLIAAVRVTNFTGQQLNLGEGEAWLSFNIERRGTVIQKLKNMPVAGEFTLESSEVGTKRVDLAPYFDLTQPGNYRVVAVVQVPELNETIQSGSKNFNIGSGTKIWDQDFGVPLAAGEQKRLPEIRKYALIQANQGPQLQLYFRLSNPAETYTYRIFPVGRILSFSYPEHQVDRRSQLHMIYQDGSKRFRYFIFNTDGEMIARQTYFYTDSRPKLAVGKDGEIAVSGGARNPNSTDIPQPSAAASSSDAKDSP